MSEQQEDRRKLTIAGLRQLADFLEAHPEVPTPICTTMNAFVDREELSRIARVGSWEKEFLSDWFCLRRTFGPDLQFDINVSRNEVCRKVVTGTQVVPAQPERTVETFEWVCDDVSILKPDNVSV